MEFKANKDAKSEQRIRYDAEIELIRRRFGSLEDMRMALGLSQRKMAELIMVDPSAWTRWTKGSDGDAPPHVYRALAWYMELREKLSHEISPVAAAKAVVPAKTQVTEKYAPVSTTPSSAGITEDQIENLRIEMREAWDREKAELIQKVSKAEQVTLGWKLFLMINTALVIYLIFAALF